MIPASTALTIIHQKEMHKEAPKTLWKTGFEDKTDSPMNLLKASHLFSIKVS